MASVFHLQTNISHIKTLIISICLLEQHQLVRFLSRRFSSRACSAVSHRTSWRRLSYPCPLRTRVALAVARASLSSCYHPIEPRRALKAVRFEAPSDLHPRTPRLVYYQNFQDYLAVVTLPSPVYRVPVNRSVLTAGFCRYALDRYRSVESCVPLSCAEYLRL